MSNQNFLTHNLQSRLRQIESEQLALKMLRKSAFIPSPAMPQGPPPMDPAMMQAAPPVDPATGMPMDPAMMQGAPMDPATGMPMDPAAQGGAPPAPPVSAETIEQIIGLLEEMGGQVEQLGAALQQMTEAHQKLEQSIADNSERTDDLDQRVAAFSTSMAVGTEAKPTKGW